VNLKIRQAKDEDRKGLIDLTLLAFEPIFKSFEKILGPEIYPVIYPDWKITQTETVENELNDEAIKVWVGEIDGNVVGLVTQKIDPASKVGEIHFLAVHPDFQNKGIGTALIAFVFEELRAEGMCIAMVSTGGDLSHGPARRTYEKAGFCPLPIFNYYKKL